ncbi:efflux RND transporter periplasmic adaptor subunit [Algiphilus sp. NNCM1]|uniref:efflux RND transporter periplasmic adaptor subunit n=1 Tax=Algiphilus sp. TaxID=1872431 RepID=UPI001CA68EBA|nr:efflux RND transporter periplasmic adaptor subunit [Algiphilus sp.]MBY8964461.1 efflux RND transporter periplasmic adaptor subunit [Algiphilus acroporae]MCI5063713.1 efflux RND transporter periplasmic adaptor subunit [Algiphilus sp.]MCI5103145.1 efflux RND transporter periplasmic adaptor subunit [Algiphilus sp.]
MTPMPGTPLRAAERAEWVPGRRAGSLRAALLGAALLGAALLSAACGGERAPHEPPPPRSFPVPTTVVTAQKLPLFHTGTGSVVSDERVDIGSRVAAYIRAIEVREGEQVSKGQRLATLDARDIEAAIRAADAALAEARAARDDARRDLEDARTLHERGAVSGARLRKARLQLQLASDALAAAEAEFARARAQRQYVRILSPIDGLVVARHQRAGDMASPGTPLLTVESDSILLFETQVAESTISAIRIGDSVQVRIDALGRKRLQGEVQRRVASGDPVTRRFEVKIRLPEAEGLLPGMFGRARFTVGTREAVVVPATAVVERGGVRGAYVVDENARVRFRWLRTEEASGQGLIVSAGLDPGERIVLAPPQQMREGDLVTAAAEAS